MLSRTIPKSWIYYFLVCSFILFGIHTLKDTNRQIDDCAAARDNTRTSTRNPSVVDPPPGPAPMPQPSQDEQRVYPCDSECERKKEAMRRVDCLGIMEGEQAAQKTAKHYLQYHPRLPDISDDHTADITSDCAKYRAQAYHSSKPFSQSEAEFPIAYSIVAHRDAFQITKLLQAIYWPQNWYCIHIDIKAKRKVQETVNNLANCLPHVIVPTKRESIIYGGMSRLQADLNCMEELIKNNKTWKYLINLTGQMYPLRTNNELVKILKIYNGANDIEGFSKSATTQYRERYWYHWEVNKDGKLVKHETQKKDHPPGNITLIKGSAFGVFSREFVEFALTNQVAQEFLTWLADTWSPDELFWATLNANLYNPHLKAPGSYDLVPERKPWLAAYASWPPRDKCYGKNIHGVCVFSYLDLPNLISQKHLFANKFYIDKDYLVLDCLEQWLYNKTFHHVSPVDYEFYRNLPFIKKGPE